jgi:4-amino-4-deoxy-L-arabinose transferase-like glycosyltransferase
MGSLLCKKRIIILAILAAILFLYFMPLGSHGLLEPDEGRYAEIPREMIESGNFITPKLNYVKYFEKPVLLYWMNAADFIIFGENEFAARVAPALCALSGALVTALLGTLIFGVRAGILSGIITSLSLLYFAIGTINSTDMPLSFFLTLALASFYTGNIRNDRRWYMLFYAAMALGLLTKGLVAVVLPGGIIFWYVIFTRKWNLIIDVLYIPGIIIFSAISLPWFYLVCRDNPDFFYFFFVREHFLRYATKIADRYEPFWYFLPLIPAGLMPWTGFFFALLSKKSIIRTPSDNKSRDSNIFLLTWFAVILIFFSISSSKLIPYIVPCIPPLALLIGADIDRMVSRREWHGGAVFLSAGIALIFSAALVIYALKGDKIPQSESLPMALKLSLGLLLGPLSAIWFSRKKRKSFNAAVAMLSISAFIFTSGLCDIYGIMGKTRSSRSISDVIIKEKLPDETIAVYGEVLQGIPFYTKQRVMLIDYMGEMEFGARQTEGEGWFPGAREFREQWYKGQKHFVLIVKKDRLSKLFQGRDPEETKKIETEKYVILFNRRQQ